MSRTFVHDRKRITLFNRRLRIVKRKIWYCKLRGKGACAGTTFTDGLNEVWFTCFLFSRKFSIFNINIEKLFSGNVTTPEEFYKALKKADKKQRSLRL